MQWILQEFEDVAKLRDVLQRLGLPHSTHKLVPFVGDLTPEPAIPDTQNVVLFGGYSLWRYAKRHGLKPGVFRLRPFSQEIAWQPFLLNGPDAVMMPLRAVPSQLPWDDRPWFVRPLDDSKAIAGQVMEAAAIHTLADKVLALPEQDIPDGSLRPETEMMFSTPAKILKEWRLWVVADQVVTWSLYVEGRRVVYRPEIDGDALDFARSLVAVNPGYAPAYVLDVCRTKDGLRMLETNCINAAGFYAADLAKLVAALEDLSV